jgi:glycosyltransferase involved in cell wall biosynthesis
MNILFTETLKNWGGQQARVLQEITELNRRGHRAVLACNKGSIISRKANEEGIRTYELNFAKWSYPLSIPRLISVIKREGVDLVCTNSSIDSWAGGIAALYTSRELVRIKHNMYRIKRDLPTRFIYSLPKRFIAVSDSALEEILKAGHIPAEKVRKVYGAIDPGLFNPYRISEDQRADLRSSLGIPENSLVIGNTSGFTGVKGQRYLLTAANRLFERGNDIYLLLAGRIVRKERILQAVPLTFRDRVLLPGLRDDVPGLLSLMDIFVFPSTVEAFGYSLIEAMAMAKPVVVSDITSFKGIVTDKVNGIFFKAADSEDLFNTLLTLIENPEDWHVLGKNARKTVSERFQPGKMFNEVEEIYLDLIKKGNKDDK